MNRLLLISVLLLSLVPVSTHAAGPAKMSPEAGSINQSLDDALARDGVARIEVTLDLSEKSAADAEHPAAGSDVHPVVFDIAMMAAGGPMQLDQAGDFHVLSIAATAEVVAKIVGMDDVLAVQLDTKPVKAMAPMTKAGGCPATSTRACFTPNYGVSVSYGGVLGKVAASGPESAAFWAYGPNNWEVLAKVLNGCGVNNHWWLFGAAAGSNSYSIGVTIFLPTGTLALGS